MLSPPVAPWPLPLLGTPAPAAHLSPPLDPGSRTSADPELPICHPATRTATLEPEAAGALEPERTQATDVSVTPVPDMAAALCSSHRSEAVHVASLAGMADTVPLSTSCLGCSGLPPQRMAQPPTGICSAEGTGSLVSPQKVSLVATQQHPQPHSQTHPPLASSLFAILV